MIEFARSRVVRNPAPLLGQHVRKIYRLDNNHGSIPGQGSKPDLLGIGIPIGDGSSLGHLWTSIGEFDRAAKCELRGQSGFKKRIELFALLSSYLCRV